MARNIILLSDGTGNAASSVWHTNVWRTFKSIDLTGVDQVACYDDGGGHRHSSRLLFSVERSVGASSATFCNSINFFAATTRQTRRFLHSDLVAAHTPFVCSLDW